MPRPLIAIGAIGLAVGAVSGQTQPPAFRATAETVAVNVSVKNGNAPVQGLSVEDFQLYDNDVPQPIAAVSLDAVPVDVSFVLKTHSPPLFDVEPMRRALQEMVAFLRPSDRYRVLTTGNAVINTVPWRAAGPPDISAIHVVAGRSAAMIADAVLMGLLHRQSPDRRHLVVALATSEDWCSLSSGDALRRGAERSGAVFHWINMTGETIHGTPPGPVPLGVRGQCRTEGNPTDIGGILGEAARVTGGTVHSQWFGTWDHIDRVAVEAFDKIFDDFRRSYVLYYVPRGVDPAGWHRLRVETPGKNFALRSRTGYWALTDAPAPSRK